MIFVLNSVAVKCNEAEWQTMVLKNATKHDDDNVDNNSNIALTRARLHWFLARTALDRAALESASAHLYSLVESLNVSGVVRCHYIRSSSKRSLSKIGVDSCLKTYYIYRVKGRCNCIASNSSYK
jgi:hypothetical protein